MLPIVNIVNVLFKVGVSFYAIFFSAKMALQWYNFKPKYKMYNFAYDISCVATIIGLLLMAGLIIAL